MVGTWKDSNQDSIVVTAYGFRLDAKYRSDGKTVQGNYIGPSKVDFSFPGGTAWFGDVSTDGKVINWLPPQNMRWYKQ
jgi:hypothetical protein